MYANGGHVEWRIGSCFYHGPTEQHEREIPLTGMSLNWKKNLSLIIYNVFYSPILKLQGFVCDVNL